MPYNIAYGQLNKLLPLLVVACSFIFIEWLATSSTHSQVCQGDPLCQTDILIPFQEEWRAISTNYRRYILVTYSHFQVLISRHQKLIDRGHKVIIITHAYEGRTGIHYLTNGLKVYHVPFLVIYRETTFPTVFSFFPIFRNIVIREQIEIVHGHASLSNLCHEAILHARTMGLRTVFTDHSLFGFADAASILTNKLLKFALSDVDHVICVSHTWYELSSLGLLLPKAVPELTR